MNSSGPSGDSREGAYEGRSRGGSPNPLRDEGSAFGGDRGLKYEFEPLAIVIENPTAVDVGRWLSHINLKAAPEFIAHLVAAIRTGAPLNSAEFVQAATGDELTVIERRWLSFEGGSPSTGRSLVIGPATATEASASSAENLALHLAADWRPGACTARLTWISEESSTSIRQAWLRWEIIDEILRKDRGAPCPATARRADQPLASAREYFFQLGDVRIDAEALPNGFFESFSGWYEQSRQSPPNGAQPRGRESRELDSLQSSVGREAPKRDREDHELEEKEKPSPMENLARGSDLSIADPSARSLARICALSAFPLPESFLSNLLNGVRLALFDPTSCEHELRSFDRRLAVRSETIWDLGEGEAASRTRIIVEAIGSLYADCFRIGLYPHSINDEGMAQHLEAYVEWEGFSESSQHRIPWKKILHAAGVNRRG